MISGLLRFVIFRIFGARVLLVLAVLGWLRNRLWPKPETTRDRGTGRPARRVG